MTFCPRRHSGPAGFFEARFAPRSPRTLEVPFRGAKSSHNSCAAARGPPAFPRRGLLPAPCKPLRLRSGEQILHTIPAPPPGAGRLFPGRGLLPPPREALFFRLGEQNLHTIPAPPSGAARAARAAHPKIPEAHSASGIFPLLLSSSTYPFPPAGIPESGNSPLPGGLPCRKAGIPQSSSG